MDTFTQYHEWIEVRHVNQWMMAKYLEIKPLSKRHEGPAYKSWWLGRTCALLRNPILETKSSVQCSSVSNNYLT